MSDKTSNLYTSENNETQDANAQHKENPTTIRKNDLSNVIESDNTLTELVNTIPTQDNDVKQDNTLMKQAKELPKKHLSDKKTDIATYLKTEFTGLPAKDQDQDTMNKLTKYKDIDNIGYSRKFADKNPKNLKSSFKKNKRKSRQVYSNDTVTVQFFASENILEGRGLMEYEPEAWNFTVKGMLFVLTMMYLLILVVQLLFRFTKAAAIFTPDGPIYCIAPVCVLIITIIAVVCLKQSRQPRFGCLILFVPFFCVSFIGSALGGDLSIRIFVYMYSVLTFTAFTCALLGCFKYDYTSKMLYAIALGSGVLYMLIIIPAFHFGPDYTRYWYLANEDTPLTLSLCVISILISIAAMVAELHFLLDGKWVELAEDDYVFGAVLLFISVIDFPIRMMRKYLTAKQGEEEEEE